MPRLPTHNQEFGSRHRDTQRCCQTHAFLSTLTRTVRQLYHEATTHTRLP